MMERDFMESFMVFARLRKNMMEFMRQAGQCTDYTRCSGCPKGEGCDQKPDPDGVDIHVREIKFKAKKPEFSKETEEKVDSILDNAEQRLHTMFMDYNGSILAQRMRKPKTFYYEYTDVDVTLLKPVRKEDEGL